MRKFWMLTLMLLTATRASGQESLPPLRALAEEAGMHIGAAINTGAFHNDAAYLQRAAQEFNIITPENIFKYGPLSPAPDTYNWADADALVDWAEANGIRVHGHVLVWHNQQPGWLDESKYSPEELEAILENHIKTVVGRYKGRIQEWDVVNEALPDSGDDLRDTIWLRAIGPEYIAKAFQWAHEADPDALLFYNDYNIDTPGRKTNNVFNLVSGLVEAGVPIHGVGLQMHVSARQLPSLSVDTVRGVMDRFGRLGLKVEITEMDVKIGDGAREDGLEPQAQVYRNVLQACIDAPNCDTFITWGFTDRYSWIPAFVGHDDWALPLDEDLNAKPAYDALAETLASAAAAG
ncbi:MAG: endo-1,4-beta-xylanase [Anaerolineae bacterium]|nr:endo-1,4-beta-xylanase [Anaerolineae bacterium]